MKITRRIRAALASLPRARAAEAITALTAALDANTAARQQLAEAMRGER